MPGAREHASGLEAVVDLFPAELGDEDVRQRLKQFTRDLDQMTRTGSDGNVVVDEDIFEQILTGGTFPDDLQERVRSEARTHLHGHLHRGSGGGKLTWHQLAAHEKSLQPSSIDELKQLGINHDTTVKRAKQILHEHYPQLPLAVLDADGPELHQLATRALQHNRTVWDCCVAHLGWWGALWVFAAVGALLIVGTATGPWGIPLLIWLIAVLGGGTAVIVMNCVLNPNL